MKTGVVLVVALTGLAAWSVAASQLAPASRPQDVARESRIDALFTREIRPDSPGCAVGVYRNGDIVFARGYGVASVEDRRPITPRTTFNLGSLSKPFTTLAVLMLEQARLLSIDDDVRRWVPELPAYDKPIRVRDLLQHTTGLRDHQALELLAARPVNTMADFLGLLAAQRALNFVPGTRHEYSHSDYGVLGLIVERVAGAPFAEHLRRNVLEPMGMNGSFVDDGRNRAVVDRAFGHATSPQGPRVRFPNPGTFGGDSVYASIEDLAHFDRNFDTPVVGGPAVIARMISRPTLPNGDTIPYAYGLRLDTYRGLRTILRAGHPPGTQSVFIRFADQRLAVATLCNADHLQARRFADGVADLFLGDQMTPAPPPPKAPAAAAMSPEALARYVGIYQPLDDPWNVSPIEVRNGVLGEVWFDDARDFTFFPMIPAGDGRFFEIGSTGNVGTFVFKPGASGAPLRLEVSWNDGPVDVLERVPDPAVWRPSAVALAAYAGRWFGQDIDASWQLQVRDTRLVLRRRGQPDVTLLPVAADRFLRAFGPDSELSVRLQFHRDSARRLTHLTVSTRAGEDSVQNLRFERVQ